MSSIELYAELLLNIRTVTLFACLKSDHTEETKAELSADGETITLTHEGESASIRLPTQISGGGSATLTLPASPAKELTFRLQLQERSPGLLKFRDEPDNLVPWSATSMAHVSRIACRNCSNELVESGNISIWKDLPNESWAETMDFWHCHKPDEHHLHGSEAGKNKGYAASNKLRAVSGIGLVDLSYFLLAEQDCCGMHVRRLPDIYPETPLQLLMGTKKEAFPDSESKQWLGLRYNCPRATHHRATASAQAYPRLPYVARWVTRECCCCQLSLVSPSIFKL